MSKDPNKSIIEAHMLEKSASAGLSAVYRTRTLTDKKNAIRSKYASEVLSAVVFDQPHPEKESLMEELAEVEKAYSYQEPDYNIEEM